MFNKTVRSIVVLAYNKSIEIKMSQEIKERKPLPPRTAYVNAICNQIGERSGHVVVNALAGTGKTTTILQSINDFPTASVRAQTCHGFGYGAWRFFLKGQDIKVDDCKVKNILRSITRYEYLNIDERDRLDLMFGAAEALVSLFKSQGFIAIRPEATDDDCDALVDRYDVSLPEADSGIQPAEVFELARKALIENNKQKTVIDFDDMIYFPVLYKVSFYKNDLVYVDECLPSWVPVLLSDGTSKTIGEIVDNKLDVEVLSFNTETGQQEPCKVTGWSRTLNQKPLVKIKAQWRKKKETNRPTNFVVCTTDHKIWANGKWIPAGELKIGMDVQIETSAHKSQAGKITSKGRISLGEEMSSKNESGVMKTNNRLGVIKVRGGNGKSPTLAEQTLADELGNGWKINHAVPTHLRSSGLGYPTCYKIDIANIDRKIAIEVDGESHRVRKYQDQKKDEFLRSQGWKVFRVQNREAIQNTKEVAAKISKECNGEDCPIVGTIKSIEPIDIPDNYVYDIHVDKCHNFYANGILVHNCQDLNPIRIALIERAAGNWSQCVFVGDRNQSIYGFTGADTEAIDSISQKFNATELPLSTCWRCPVDVIKTAQSIVPAIEHAPNAVQGSVSAINPVDMMKNIEAGDFVLCRTTAPVVQTCLSLIRAGKAATVRGRDIGKGLIALASKIAKKRGNKSKELMTALNDWRQDQERKFSAPGQENKLQAALDKVDTLIVLAEDCSTFDQLKKRIESIFANDNGDDIKNIILCSTVHKSKGLESPNVYVIYPELLPGPWAKQAWQKQQEMNLKYVAITRAERNLFWVDPEAPASEVKEVVEPAPVKPKRTRKPKATVIA